MSARSVFADLLAAYRKDAGWTQAEAAQRFTMSKSLYSKIESCDRKPQRDMAARSDELFGTLKVFTRIYKDIVTEPHPAWFGPRAEFEDRASVITDWEIRGVPGLLQTEAYARTVTQAGMPYATPDVIERYVVSRMERQEILTRDKPPKLWAVIAEGAVRQLVGGRDVMAAQLDNLIASADAPSIVLQILPFTATDAPVVEGSASLLEFDDHLPVVYLEGWGTGRVIEDPVEVADIAAGLNMIKSCGLSPRDSKVLLTKIRAEVEKQ